MTTNQDIPASPGNGYGNLPGMYDRQRLQGLAERAKAERDLRYAHFDRSLFGEPVWDILLALYLATAPQEKTLAAIGEFCGLAIGTCARWLRIMGEHGLVALDDGGRGSAGFHLRASLTKAGRGRVDAYFAECNRMA